MTLTGHRCNFYKHQWHVISAVASLRREGLPVVLDLVGGFHPRALIKLHKAQAHYDPEGNWVRFHGNIAYQDLHQWYTTADLGIFASSCENMPNILLEKMASGLPIACSNRGPMPEVLGHDGTYFDPEQSHDISRALRELIDSPERRAFSAEAGYQIALRYDWHRCADETFHFLTQVASEAYLVH